MTSHLETERSRWPSNLQTKSPTVVVLPMPSSSPTSASSVSGTRKRAQNISQASTKEAETSVDASQLQSPRRNRERRREESTSRKSESTPSITTGVPSPSATVSRTPIDDIVSPVCFLCGELLVGDLVDVNAHVDRCLAAQEQRGDDSDSTLTPQSRHHKRKNDEQSDSSRRKRGRPRKDGPASSVETDPGLQDAYDTYTWAGQTRVRATSLVQGGFAALGYATSRHDNTDVDEDLEVENDETSTFGVSQYTENDLVYLSTTNEDVLLHSRVTGTSVKSKRKRREAIDKADADVENCADEDQALEEEEQSTTPGAQRLLINALKAQIKQQDLMLQNASKCLVCLNLYNVPLVSIQCWHVHCEQCWLKTLGAKKLCPQCNVITSPGDLRRVYL